MRATNLQRGDGAAVRGGPPPLRLSVATALARATRSDRARRRDRPAFRADDRIAKTLLLAALVPTVEALQGLTLTTSSLSTGARSKASSGPGDIDRRPEAAHVVFRVGELKLSDDLTNPTAAIQLTGIDIDAILDRARHNDTEGERRKLLREMLLAEFGVVISARPRPSRSRISSPGADRDVRSSSPRSRTCEIACGCPMPL